MTIVEFVLARVDEDEKVARTVGNLRAVSITGFPGRYIMDLDTGAREEVSIDLLRAGLIERWHTHAANHPPSRTLAECQAKRAIVARHVPSESKYPSPSGSRCDACSDTQHDGWWYEETPWPCPTLRYLAAVHSEHPDYQPEWAPTTEV